MHMIFAVFSLVTTQALAAPQVTVDGRCPSNNITVQGAAPHARLAIMVGNQLSPDVFGQGVCADTATLVTQLDPSFRRITATADAGGQVRVSLPAGMTCDEELQVLDLTTCETSWPASIGRPACNLPVQPIYTPDDLRIYEQCQHLQDVEIGPNLIGRDLRHVALPQAVAIQSLTTTFDPADAPTLDLPALATVDTMQLSTRGTLSLPALQHVNVADLTGGITEVYMPSLETVGQALTVDDLPRLERLWLPKLAEVASSAGSSANATIGQTGLSITRNALLRRVSLRALQSTTSLEVRGNTSLCIQDDPATAPSWRDLTYEDSIVVTHNAPWCRDITRY